MTLFFYFIISYFEPARELSRALAEVKPANEWLGVGVARLNAIQPS